MIRTGTVTQVYQRAGAPICDIADEATGSIYLRCPVLMLGGATQEQHLHVPPVAKGSRVVFAPYRGSSRGAVVLGSIAPSSVGSLFQSEVESDPATDYPTSKVGLKDGVWRNGGAVIVVTDSGLIVLDTASSGQSVNVQLGGGQSLRISRNGQEPTERLLMEGPTRDLLDTLVDHINDLQTQVTTLTTAVQTLGSPVPAFVATELAPTGTDLAAGAILISDETAEISTFPTDEE